MVIIDGCVDVDVIHTIHEHILLLGPEPVNDLVQVSCLPCWNLKSSLCIYIVRLNNSTKAHLGFSIHRVSAKGLRGSLMAFIEMYRSVGGTLYFNDCCQQRITAELASNFDQMRHLNIPTHHGTLGKLNTPTLASVAEHRHN